MRHLIFLLSLFWLLCSPAVASGDVHLILSEDAAAYQTVANSFRAGIGPRQSVKVWTLANINAAQVRELTRGSGLVVPVGVKATRFVAANHVGQAPVLALMIPRATSESLKWPAALSRKKISAIFIDQPPERSLALVEAAFPAARNVGLVISLENEAVAKALAKEAARRNLRLNAETITSSEALPSALRRVLSESDVLLLVPDAIAINAGNAQNVLLTTYRFRIPVVGFSQGLTKAGAVVSVYSSPAQIGLQGGQSALRLDEFGELPSPRHARENSLAFNPHVARSLGLVLPDEAEIRRKLESKND
jgi:putative tryptophan/tyrosine transport system substrate-binding protein